MNWLTIVGFLILLQSVLGIYIPYPNQKTVEYPPSYGFTRNHSHVLNSQNETCEQIFYPYPKGLYTASTTWNDQLDVETPYKVLVHKLHNSSHLKIQISTEWQCVGDGISCRWEILFNGYPCIPNLYHEIYNAPSGVQVTRETFTGYCNAWKFGGGTPLYAGEYNVTMVESSMKSFTQEKWILPDGTRPHGAYPRQIAGNPRIGRVSVPHFMYVSEINATNEPRRTIYQHQNQTEHQLQFPLPALDTKKSFSFFKTGHANETFIKVTYYDNFRCHTRVRVNGISDADTCYFEILVDGASCSPNPVRLSVRIQDHSNYYVGHTLLGRCDGLSQGQHIVSVRMSGDGEPSSGYFSTVSQFEIEELSNDEIGTSVQTWGAGCRTSESPSLSIVCFPATEPDRNCNLNCREWNFVKPSNDSIFQIEWFDNWYCRVGSCDLEVRVNDLACSDPGPLVALYDDDLSRQDMRTTVMVFGQCRKWGPSGIELPAGTHKLTIYDRVLVQNSGWAVCRDCNYNTNNRPEIGFGATGFMHVQFPKSEYILNCNSTYVN